MLLDNDVFWGATTVMISTRDRQLGVPSRRPEPRLSEYYKLTKRLATALESLMLTQRRYHLDASWAAPALARAVARLRPEDRRRYMENWLADGGRSTDAYGAGVGRRAPVVGVPPVRGDRQVEPELPATPEGPVLRSCLHRRTR